MVMLAKLPNELLLKVLEYFPVSSESFDGDPDIRLSIETLAALCRTCRLFQDLATPMLYHTVFVSHRHNRLPSSFRSLRKLTRTLLERPSLRNFVRFVKIWNTRQPGTGYEDYQYPHSTEIRHLYEDITQSFSLGSRHEGWVNYLQGKARIRGVTAIREDDESSTKCGYLYYYRSEDAACALLLFLTPNILELDLQFLYSPMDATGAPCYVLAFLKSAGSSFTALKKLTLSSDYKNPLMHHDAIPCLSHLVRNPNLETFEARGSFTNIPLQIDKQLSARNLRHIDLHECSATGSEIYHILQGCSILQTFSLVSKLNEIYHLISDDYRLTWCSTVKALRSSSKHLQSIFINLRDGLGHRAMECEADPSSPLEDFTALKRLAMTETVLLGTIRPDKQGRKPHYPEEDDSSLYESTSGQPVLLAPQLESLCIMKTTNRTMWYLRSLVCSLPIMLPSLRLITLEIDRKLALDDEQHVGERLEAVASLARELQTVGIRLESDFDTVNSVQRMGIAYIGSVV